MVTSGICTPSFKVKRNEAKKYYLEKINILYSK